MKRETPLLRPTRRAFLAASAALALPVRARAEAREIGWEDLVPSGLPAAGIAADGIKDEVNDIWRPVYDENGWKVNDAVVGTLVKLPGFMIPLEVGAAGVSEFILVPYAGACIHVPPPPPNQLVHVTAKKPWPENIPFEAVWVTGLLRAEAMAAELADIGYRMEAQAMEKFVW